MKVTKAMRSAGILEIQLELLNSLHVVLVEVNKIYTDKGQRVIDSNHKQRIYDGFNPKFSDPPVCTFRSDSEIPKFKGKPTIFCADGQHRAAVYLNHPLCHCLPSGKRVIQVHMDFNADRIEAFKHFSYRNARKVVNAIDKFKNALASGELDQTEIYRLAKHYGLTTPCDTDGRADLMHLGAYVEFYRMYDEVIEQYFWLFKTCFRRSIKVHRPKGDSFGVGFAKGVMQFLLDNDKLTKAQLTAIFKSPDIVPDLEAAAANRNKMGRSKYEQNHITEAIESRLRDVRLGFRAVA